jgi:hypothetical protein
MSKLSVVRSAVNGKKPLAKSAPKGNPLVERVDDLYRLRTLIRKSQEAEREMTAEVLAALDRLGADRFEGGIAAALVIPRTTLTPDVGLFIGALGPRAYAALSVKVEAARAIMAADDLAAISESSTAATLRLEARKAPALHAEPKAVRP